MHTNHQQNLQIWDVKMVVVDDNIVHPSLLRKNV